jgi:hypothetical protein
MVKVWLPPYDTAIFPDGEIVPPAPAEALMVKVLAEKVAKIVWLAVTFPKVYELIAP